MTKHRLSDWLDRVEDSAPMQAIRKGLVMTIPLLTLGAVALIFQNLPIAAYQQFIKSFLNGALYAFFSYLHEATFGYLSLYLTIAVSLSYAQHKTEQGPSFFTLGAVFTALISFAILSGVRVDNFGTATATIGFKTNIDALGVKGMFVAIVTAVCVSAVYARLATKRALRLKLYSDGADSSFNSAMQALAPMVIITGSVALINVGLMALFEVDSLQTLFIKACDHLFEGRGQSLGNGLLFIVVSSVFWFFGIHGSDVLEHVMETVFAVPAATAGVAVNKCFIEVFVLMGGCGAALCLLLATLLFAKRKNSRTLAKLALFPVAFNINELVIFGLPVVFNPVLLAPFLMTPVLCALTTYAAMALGWVPPATGTVIWTTPVFWSGYLATGSLAGSALQLVNLCLGVLLYRPFILKYEKSKSRSGKQKLDRLIALLKRAEEDGSPLELLKRADSEGELARMLVSDLADAMVNREIRMYYQPHHDNARRCVGAEALMRWEHPSLGMIYPPLVVKLAQEAHLLKELEFAIFDIVARDLRTLAPHFEGDFHIGVNITPYTLNKPDLLPYLSDLIDREGIKPGELMIEITEQMAMSWNSRTEETLSGMKALGVLIAIDDFSMGHTSLQYMQCQSFGVVKLDGGLVRGVCQSQRNREIVSSIIGLAETLDYLVIAEFVETEAQFAMLGQLGCHQYQGYLFSPALRLDAFEDYLAADALRNSPCQTAPRADSAYQA